MKIVNIISDPNVINSNVYTVKLNTRGGPNSSSNGNLNNNLNLQQAEYLLKTVPFNRY